MTNVKNKTVILNDGHECRFHEMLNNYVRKWTCGNSTCKCYFEITQHGVNGEILNDHNHNEPSEQDINRRKLNK